MIIFLISSITAHSGYGGHYYDLIHIAEEVAKREPVKIVNIGIHRAPALDLWRGDVCFLKTGSRVAHILLDLCYTANVDILHSFDLYSAYYATIVGTSNKIPYVCTKTGGPIPYRKIGHLGRWPYPVSPIQTVVHEADYQWFIRRGGYRILEVIKARVKRPELNPHRPKDIEKYFRDADLRIIRIARISAGQLLSIEQSIAFTQFLKKRGINAKLAVIGSVASEANLKRLKSLASDETAFYTTPTFTINASDFLADCDVVIGTGRSFMEGCGAGRVMMAPVSDTKYPALVTPENIGFFEEENFSERVRKGAWGDPDKDCMVYSNILSEPGKREDLAKRMAELFELRYNAKIGAEQYLQIYHTVKSNNFDIYYTRLTRDRFILAYWFRMTYLRISKLIGDLALRGKPRK